MSSATLHVPASADEAQILALVASLHQAHHDKSAAGIAAPYAPHAVIYDLEPPLMHDGISVPRQGSLARHLVRPGRPRARKFPDHCRWQPRIRPRIPPHVRPEKGSRPSSQLLDAGNYDLRAHRQQLAHRPRARLRPVLHGRQPPPRFRFAAMTVQFSDQCRVPTFRTDRSSSVRGFKLCLDGNETWFSHSLQHSPLRSIAG